MKLKSKLYISFCVMILLPAIMFSVVFCGIYYLQKESVEKTYQVDSDVFLEGMYSPIMVFGKLTDGVFEEMERTANENPKRFDDVEYLDRMSNELKNRLSSLVVRKNHTFVYNTSELNSVELTKLLPDFVYNDELLNLAMYRGGEYQCLFKQLDFTDDEGNHYNVYIVTSLEQILPQIKTFIFELIWAMIFVLVLTSVSLNLWIYNSIVRPLKKLKLATDNIKEGNLDFTMPKVNNDEIGEVCKDFEDMRIILKKTSEENLKSELEEKELIRNISHDLKTPLTAIKGYVEGLLDGVANTPEKQEKYIRTIANKVSDMDKLIDELTIYSRLDNNRVPYTFVNVSVREYFDDCCEEIKTELEAAQIELKYTDHLLEDVDICVDPEQLKRVVNNIISNSVKYMMDGRAGRIEINLYDEGDYVHIVFSDNGMGIAAKDIERIFERFYRTDESRNGKRGGSGIGLAIVKKIVEDHKGRIWAESVEGEGTTMHLDLPKVKK